MDSAASAGREPRWHTLDASEVLDRVRSSPGGLQSAEAADRLQEYGRNDLPAPIPPGLGAIFLRQFLNPLIYVLLAAGTISLVIGDVTDAIFIFAVILLNAAIGTVQEWKAERGAAALQKMLQVFARARRDGRDTRFPAAELVPGDVVLLESGDRVPADLRLLRARNLTVDESLLTGESASVGKGVHPLSSDKPLPDRINMAFAGTTVMAGRAEGVVVATGLRTEVGQIAGAVAATAETKPPLVLRMERFARQISIGMLGVVLTLGVIALARGMSLMEVFFLAIALAVSAIPEGLPVAMTVALSIATARMAKRRVIVRRLTAVEALGSCTCIASDKTGTLTLNRQTVRRLIVPSGIGFEVTGEGSDDQGTILPVDGGDTTFARDGIARLVRAAVLCNEGELTRGDGAWVISGDAVDVALLSLGYKAGLQPERLQEEITIVGEIPYESERRYAARAWWLRERGEAAVKGALEAVLPFCTRMADEGADCPLEADRLLRQGESLAAAGYRVIGVAAGTIQTPPSDPMTAKDLSGLTFLGMAGLIDPLRPEAREAVAKCRRAGIRVLMITGDHPATALTIARQLGIAGPTDEAVTGAHLEAVGNPDVPLFLETVDRGVVFSRVAPLQKLEIVEALVRLGHFVAVTGDGVNDAPALRRANIGVAMGSGTEVAKDTASLIVTDDNFASIEGGIEEGRFAYDNIRKVIYLLISTGAAEVALFTLAILTELPAPLAAVQLLWLNLVTNGIQDVALAFEKGEPGAMERPPRSPAEGVFNRLMIQQTLVSGLTMGLLTYVLWQYLLNLGVSINEARNLLLLQMVLLENVHVFNCRSERYSAFRVPLQRNPALIAGVLIAQGIHIGAMHFPPMQTVLNIAPVSLGMWGLLLMVAVVLLLVMEGFKAIKRVASNRLPR